MDRAETRAVLHELLATPDTLLKWLDMLDFETIYDKLSPREREQMQGENKWVRILIVFIRRHVKKHARVIPKLRSGWSTYVLVAHVGPDEFVLPDWIQSYWWLEKDRYSRDFAELHQRLQQTIDLYQP